MKLSADLFSLALIMLGSCFAFNVNAQTNSEDPFSKENIALNNAKYVLACTMDGSQVLRWTNDIPYSDFVDKEFHIIISHYSKPKFGKQEIRYSEPSFYYSLRKDEDTDNHIITSRYATYFSTYGDKYMLSSDYVQTEVIYNSNNRFTKIEENQNIEYKHLSNNGDDEIGLYIFYDKEGNTTRAINVVYDKLGRIVNWNGGKVNYTDDNRIANVYQDRSFVNSLNVSDSIDIGSSFIKVLKKDEKARWSSYEIYRIDATNKDFRYHNAIYERYLTDIEYKKPKIQPIKGQRVYFEDGKDDVIALVKGYEKGFFMGHDNKTIILECGLSNEWEGRNTEIGRTIKFPYPEAFQTNFLRTDEDPHSHYSTSQPKQEEDQTAMNDGQNKTQSQKDSLKQARKERRKSRLKTLGAAAAAAAVITEAVKNH